MLVGCSIPKTQRDPVRLSALPAPTGEHLPAAVVWSARTDEHRVVEENVEAWTSRRGPTVIDFGELVASLERATTLGTTDHVKVTDVRVRVHYSNSWFRRFRFTQVALQVTRHGNGANRVGWITGDSFSRIHPKVDDLLESSESRDRFSSDVTKATIAALSAAPSQRLAEECPIGETGR